MSTKDKSQDRRTFPACVVTTSRPWVGLGSGDKSGDSQAHLFVGTPSRKTEHPSSF
jgi:hypothetical protein